MNREITELNQKITILEENLKVKEQNIKVCHQRITNYSELLQMAINLFTKQQYEKYITKFFELKEKQNKESLKLMIESEKCFYEMVNKILG